MCCNACSFANTLAGYLADCPDYICNFGSWLSDLLNQLIDDCIASLHIDGVSSLADLFIKALSYVVPVSAICPAGSATTTQTTRLVSTLKMPFQ